MQPRLRKVIKAKKPTHIAVADKPLLLGGKIEKITIAEFEQRTGIHYDESIYIDPGLKLNELDLGIFFSNKIPRLESQIKNLLASPNEHVVLCKMGNYGHGVFAARDLPKDTVIAIYAGTIMPTDVPYEPKDETLKFKDSPIRISCRHNRGIATFMQHLPEPTQGANPQEHAKYLNNLDPRNHATAAQVKLIIDLFSIQFSTPEIKASLAMQNVQQLFLSYTGVPLIVFLSDGPIKRGQQLGFNYGYNYWAARRMMSVFFDQQGREISPLSWRKTYGALPLERGRQTFAGDFEPFIKKIKDGVSNFDFEDPDKQPYVMSAASLTICLFEVNAIRLEFNPDMVFPQQVNIVDADKNNLHTIKLEDAFEDSIAQNLFYELRKSLGPDNVRQLAFRPVYEISYNYLQSLLQNQPQKFKPILTALNLSEEDWSRLGQANSTIQLQRQAPI